MMSKYFQSLDESARNRYLEKIQIIDSKDPYCLDQRIFFEDPTNFPQVEWGDIVNYLVFGRSKYTLEQFKAFKSLEAYNQFVCKWIKHVRAVKIDVMVLVMAEVLHSQKLAEKPLEPWIIATHDGIIQSAHCTCVAGLGEACMHVAALLFFIQDAVHNLEETSVTSVLPYWTSPSSQNVKFCEVDNIDFSTPMRKRKHSSLGTVQPIHAIPQPGVSQLSDTEFLEVLNKLQKTNSNAAVLNVVKPFCLKKPNAYPKELLAFFDETLLAEDLSSLQKRALDVQISITQIEADNLQRDSVKQSKSSLWFQHRAGRITASKFKAVCHTNISKPSVSLIKAICYPQLVKFTNKAVIWGCTHEKEARKQYVLIKKKDHENLKIDDCGLIVNINHPHFGVTPDGFVECLCCGKGCLEVKCPFCIRHCSKEEMQERKTCLESTANGHRLKRDHTYYFQVQAQLFISELGYCDFIMYTEKALFIERIFPDIEFWNEHVPIANSFFRLVILPEIIGKCFTRKSESSVLSKNTTEPVLIRFK